MNLLSRDVGMAANHTNVFLMMFQKSFFNVTSLKQFLGRTLQLCSVWLEEASLLPLQELGFNVAQGTMMEYLFTLHLVLHTVPS